MTNKHYKNSRAVKTHKRTVASRSAKRYPKGSFLHFVYSKAGKITIGVLAVLLLLVGSGMLYGYSLLSRINYTPLDQFEQVDSIAEEKDELTSGMVVVNNPDEMQFSDGDVMQDGAVQNILLIGSDTRGNEVYGRSDSMILVSVDRKHNKLKMTSLMRDMYVKIPGREDNRINAAYAYGGPALLIDTIEQNFKVHIDNYVRIDFNSFEKMIDLVGGVPITISEAEAEEINADLGTSYGAGTYVMSGASALRYARIRHVDSDFGRTQRQRNVLETLLKELKGSSVGTINNFLNQILPLVQTDLTQGALVGLAAESPTLMSWPLSQARLPADGEYASRYIREMAVLVPDVEANKQVLQDFIYE